MVAPEDPSATIPASAGYADKMRQTGEDEAVGRQCVDCGAGLTRGGGVTGLRCDRCAWLLWLRDLQARLVVLVDLLERGP